MDEVNTSNLNNNKPQRNPAIHDTDSPLRYWSVLLHNIKKTVVNKNGTCHRSTCKSAMTYLSAQLHLAEVLNFYVQFACSQLLLSILPVSLIVMLSNI